ncbi:hypothetical protein [Amycolatopsis sp. NPDC004625]|uniref:hypothetical protein n=1 Tax=Amycolatopsis sp. NPDC004625 TaxID=3154670 RepID=UPI0033BF19D2
MNHNSGALVLKAIATSDCPTCDGFVTLAGQGKPNATVSRDGWRPNEHLVFFRPNR